MRAASRESPGGSRAAVRRSEVERVLADHGLLGPRRRPGPVTAAAKPAAARLAAACFELGPVFAAFARELGRRPDLLAPEECLVLSSVEAAAPARSPEAVAGVLSSELGGAASGFGEIDPEPMAVDWPCQLHRGRTLEDGDVLVELLLPGAEEEAAAEVPLLALLAPALAGLEIPAEEAVSDFRLALTRRLDLAATAAALASLGEDDAILPPETERPRPALGRCTRRLLVTTLPAGEPLTAAAGGPEAALLARRVWLAWLGLVLDGSAYPMAVGAGSTVAPAGGRIAFAGGPWSPSPPALRRHLSRYFEAEARGDVEDAWEALLAMQAGPARSAASPEALFLALRQGAPFRDGSWSPSGDTVAEHVFLHWRLARRHGFRPDPDLLDFQRAFTAVAALARRLAPEGDPLAEAMEERTLRGAVAELYGVMTPERLAHYAGRYTVLLAALPERIEAALRRASRGDAASGEPARAPGVARRLPAPELVLVLAFAAAAGAAALLTGGLTDAGWPLAEPAAAVVVGILGLLVLRGLGRTGSR